MTLMVLFAVVCLTWGTTWLGIKLAVQTVPPLTASGLRFLLAFPFLFPRAQRGLFVLIVVFYFGLT
jgi:putative membrane protein PagO